MPWLIEDCSARHLRPPTIEKLKLLLEKESIPYCEGKGYRNLKQLGVAVLRQFRATWKDAPLSAYKKLERLRSFFKFCHQAGWTKTNPVLQIKPPKVTRKTGTPVFVPLPPQVVEELQNLN